MIDFVFGAHTGVPGLDHVFIHGVCIGPGSQFGAAAPHELAHTPVTKMGVAYQKCRGHLRLSQLVREEGLEPSKLGF